MTRPDARERHFQASIEELLRLRGWKYIHVHNSQHGVSGWPDIAACRGRRLVLAEIKAERTRVTSEQRGWLDALGLIDTVEVYLWRFPAAWPKVARVLR